MLNLGYGRNGNCREREGGMGLGLKDFLRLGLFGILVILRVDEVGDEGGGDGEGEGTDGEGEGSDREGSCFFRESGTYDITLEMGKKVICQSLEVQELWNLQWLAGIAVYHVQMIREGAIPNEELHLEKVDFI
ncbi:hypothetical protein ACFX1X_035695 [Malus domestica]